MIKSICVCGAGTMGRGIAELAAGTGFETILFDLNQEVLVDAQNTIHQHLNKQVEKGKITTDELDTVFKRLTFTTHPQECSAELVIEAIVENMEAKANLFNLLTPINGSNTIFASNTSSLSITELATYIQYPERVAGLHFFNPPVFMKLVEIVKGPETSDGTISELRELCLQMNKTAVVCNDSPGFIVNHVARTYYLEALYLVEKELADINTVDRLMEQSGFKMGPFRLMDLIGNDINYAVSCSVYEALGKPERLKPSGLQKEKVESGALGKKTGNGYYNYPL